VRAQINYLQDGIEYRLFANGDGTKTATVTSVNNGEDELIPADCTIPDDVTYNDASYTVTAIGANAFAAAKDYLTSVQFPVGLTSIGDQVFWGCSKLTSVQFPAGLKTIGSSAFQNCSGLEGKLTFPAGLTSIGISAFWGCSSLDSVVFPDALNDIGNYAFEGCTALASVTLPSSLTVINPGVFAQCSSLSSVALPGGLTKIEVYAFQRCSGLEGTLTLPASLTSIGSSAFANCTNLDTVALLPETPPTLGGSVFQDVFAVFTCPEGSEGRYAAAYGWSAYFDPETGPGPGPETGTYDFSFALLLPDYTTAAVTGFASGVSVAELYIPDSLLYQARSTPSPKSTAALSAINPVWSQ
jgi:hypothetical protein